MAPTTSTIATSSAYNTRRRKSERVHEAEQLLHSQRRVVVKDRMDVATAVVASTPANNNRVDRMVVGPPPAKKLLVSSEVKNVVRIPLKRKQQQQQQQLVTPISTLAAQESAIKATTLTPPPSPPIATAIISREEQWCKLLARDAILRAVCLVLRKHANEPLTPHELAKEIISFQLASLSGPYPTNALSTHIGSHLKSDDKPHNAGDQILERSFDQRFPRRTSYRLVIEVNNYLDNDASFLSEEAALLLRESKKGEEMAALEPEVKADDEQIHADNAPTRTEVDEDEEEGELLYDLAYDEFTPQSDDFTPPNDDFTPDMSTRRESSFEEERSPFEESFENHNHVFVKDVEETKIEAATAGGQSDHMLLKSPVVKFDDQIIVGVDVGGSLLPLVDHRSFVHIDEFTSATSNEDVKTWEQLVDWDAQVDNPEQVDLKELDGLFR